MSAYNRKLLPLALVAAFGLTGCDWGNVDLGTSTPTVLVVSDTWVSTTRGSGGSEGATAVQQRIAALEESITALRKESGTGWVGRQDDVTGYLADLSGGSRPGDATDFMDDYGPALFAVDSSGLELDEPDTETVPGVVTTRATQVLAGVPVLDGALVFSGRSGAAGQQLTGVRGRVFPGLDVSTRPKIGEIAAADLAEKASGGKSEGEAHLVVVPRGNGVLAWEVLVVSDAPVGSEPDGPVGTYYIDAITGDVVTVRPTSMEVAVPSLVRDPDPNAVEISGVDPVGIEVRGQGLRVAAGVELTDTTTTSWDQASRRGGVSTYDADDVASDNQLPGRLIVSPDTTVRDPDALGAHVFAHDVLEYYQGLGRNSWDDNGGSLISSVNYGPDDFCNAFFNGRQMVYGNPCLRDGQQQVLTFIDPDTVGHEITHGVTGTSSGLLYTGQSGALNESFSDYFGNVIGNLVRGTDSVGIFEEGCEGLPADTKMCFTNPDGSMSSRYMLNGNDFDDYLRVLDPGERLKALGLAKQDHGGVHLNSAIWNNALWSIRSQLAKIEGVPGNDSTMARGLDRAVYAALTTRLSHTSGFFDARAAVEESIVALGLDPVVLRVAREVFDANKICAGCPTEGARTGSTVAAGPQTQLHPSVSGDRVAWLDLTGPYESTGYRATASADGSAPSLGSAPDDLEVAFAGQALLSLDFRGRITRTDETGKAELLTGVDANDALVRGFVGSDAGAAWVSAPDELTFADPTGRLTTTRLAGLGGDEVMSIGTGGGFVGAGTQDGKVYAWQPGSAPVQLGTVTGKVATIAAYGGNVLAVGCTQAEPKAVPECKATVFTADGRAYRVSDNPTVLGAAMSADYVVWPEGRGPVTAGVVGPNQIKWQDTDLRLFSLQTGQLYDIVADGGQQGFPALSGRRLVWQDAAFGGDDIMTTVLPEGL
jgi:hypothetical protein